MELNKQTENAFNLIPDEDLLKYSKQDAYFYLEGAKEKSRRELEGAIGLSEAQQSFKNYEQIIQEASGLDKRFNEALRQKRISNAKELRANDNNILRTETFDAAYNAALSAGANEDTANLAGYNAANFGDLAPGTGEAFFVEDIRQLIKEGKYAQASALSALLGIPIFGKYISKFVRKNTSLLDWTTTERGNIPEVKVDSPTEVDVFGQKVQLDYKAGLPYKETTKTSFLEYNVNPISLNLGQRENYLKREGISTYSPTIEALYTFPNYKQVSNERIIQPEEILQHIKNIPEDNAAILNSINTDRIFNYDNVFYFADEGVIPQKAFEDNSYFSSILNNTNKIPELQKEVARYSTLYSEALRNAKLMPDGNYRVEFGSEFDKPFEIMKPEEYKTRLKDINDKHFNFINESLQNPIDNPYSLSTNFEVDVRGEKGFAGFGATDNLRYTPYSGYLRDEPFSNDFSNLRYGGTQSQEQQGLIINNPPVEVKIPIERALVGSRRGEIILRHSADIGEIDRSSNVLFEERGTLPSSMLSLSEALADLKFVDKRPEYSDIIALNEDIPINQLNLKLMSNNTNAVIASKFIFESIAGVSDLFPSNTKIKETFESYLDSVAKNKAFVSDSSGYPSKSPDELKDIFYADVSIAYANAKLNGQKEFFIKVPNNFNRNINPENKKYQSNSFINFTQKVDEFEKIALKNASRSKNYLSYLGLKNIDTPEKLVRTIQYLPRKLEELRQANARTKKSRPVTQTHGFGVDQLGHLRYKQYGEDVVIDEIQFDVLQKILSESKDKSIKELSSLPFNYKKLPNNLRDLIKEEGIDRVNQLIKEGKFSNKGIGKYTQIVPTNELRKNINVSESGITSSTGYFDKTANKFVETPDIADIKRYKNFIDNEKELGKELYLLQSELSPSKIGRTAREEAKAELGLVKGIPLNSLEEGAEKLLLSLILDAKKGGAKRIILPPLEKLANARGVTLQSRNDKQYRFSLLAIDRIKKGDNLGEVLNTAQVSPLLKEGSEKYFEIYEKAFDRAIANLVKKSNGQIKPI